MLLLAAAAVLAARTSADSPDQRLISVFGSSVADGAFCAGNCSGNALLPSAAPGGCYQSRLRVYQEAHDNRTVFNNCHGGDTTTKLLSRFGQMLAVNPGFVVYGLSLANEAARPAPPACVVYCGMRRIQCVCVGVRACASYCGIQRVPWTRLRRQRVPRGDLRNVRAPLIDDAPRHAHPCNVDGQASRGPTPCRRSSLKSTSTAWGSC